MAHRKSPTARTQRILHRNLRKALPNAPIIGFTGTPILRQEKTETREIFGEFIDKYLLQDAELDGATVPILYEGRTADGLVKDASGLDQLFEDLFRHGVVLFNWRLLQLPVCLIDYVIIHELVHLQEPHHSPAFWQAIDRALPAWRTLKDTLHNDGARFLVFGMDSLRSLQ